MLTHLSIRNLAVVKSLDIELQHGLTAITGETGAGKSIAIDALGLCLGERADANMVRTEAKKADVSATFDVSQLTKVKTWLVENDLSDDEVSAHQEMIIRRVISSEGRSKAYINGVAVPVQQLKAIAPYLISVHGQHAHQLLLKSDAQRKMVDNFAAHQPLITLVKEHFQHLNSAQAEYSKLLSGQQRRADRKHLLEYQVQELDEFGLAESEFVELEIEHKKLSNSQTLLEQTQRSFYQLYEADEFNALAAVQSSLQMLSDLQEHDAQLTPIVTVLNEALINIEEASSQLRDYADHLEIDPMKMQQVEARFSQAMDLARKHQVNPEQLYSHHQALANELMQLTREDDSLVELEDNLAVLQQAYVQAASELSQSRQKAAQSLATEVEQHIRSMNMSKAKFAINVIFDENQTPQASGLDKVQFTISTNPGIQPDTLDKVVSGGELSRIGLALQVISSHGNQIPTMIFDEVDTGISGPTASVVGKLLRKLGANCQVICVTHLPQVAACGHNQMFVTKFSDDTTTETHMISLKQNERIEELARLLAGDMLTDSALANAKELLGSYE